MNSALPPPHACPSCLQRGWLLAQLAPYLEKHLADPSNGRVFDLLALSSEDLARAVAPDQAGRLIGELEAKPERAMRAALDSSGCWAVCHHDPLYPSGLRHAEQAPWALFGRGNPRLLVDLVEPAAAVAVVGARRATTYGREVAHNLGRDLAAAGITVISGMAFGVDAYAHRGALEVGRTVAVLGCGPDVAYPASHRALWRRIQESGLIFSELPPGTGAWRWSFPARNRIIAALAGMTVVVEAAQSSGSQVTADLAADLGRDLGAVPGPVTSRTSIGPNNLLAGGACVVRDAQDVLDAMLGPGARPPSSLASGFAKQAESLAALQREAEQGSELAQRQVDEGRADLNAAALDEIQTALSNQARTPESLDDVAEILRAAGFPVPYRIDSAEEAV